MDDDDDDEAKNILEASKRILVIRLVLLVLGSFVFLTILNSHIFRLPNIICCSFVSHYKARNVCLVLFPNELIRMS